MVKGLPITAAQARRLLSKIRALHAAEADLDAYLVELADAGVTVQAMEGATGEKGSETFVPRSTLHRWVLRGRAAREAASA